MFGSSDVRVVKPSGALGQSRVIEENSIRRGASSNRVDRLSAFYVWREYGPSHPTIFHYQFIIWRTSKSG